MKCISDTYGKDIDDAHRQSSLVDYHIVKLKPIEEDTRTYPAVWPSAHRRQDEPPERISKDEPVGIPHGCKLAVRQQDIDAYFAMTSARPEKIT